MSLLNVRTWTLRRRVVALCLTAGLLLSVLGGFALIAAATSNDHMDVILDVTSPMRVAGESLNAAVVDQETGIRGFAISGNEDNLRPYTDGVARENQLLDELDRLNRRGSEGGDAGIGPALGQVRQRAAAWRLAVADPVISAVRAQGPDAGRALVEAASTREFDALRASIAGLQDQIWVIRTDAADAAKRSGTILVALEVFAAVVVIFAGATLLLLLDRLVTRPVTELAEQVREVARGDYDRPITSEGSPELRGLAADVNGMRTQIAAELTEVREAREQIEWVNEQLKAQAEELTRSNRDLEQFAYVASHDLQEPLRKVASFCQLLQRRYAGQLDERADQYIGFAVDGAQRMQRLINDLLAFSRIGRLTAGFTDVDLDAVLARVRSQFEDRAGEDAEFVWSDLPTVEGEEPLLTTLFVNLIGNALKFRRPGVAPVITVTAEHDEQEWRINVRDNGIGIEAEFADKVFVIFQRLHARDAYEGTGIGLAIVKKIVEYHGGRIWLDLDVAEGASIYFTLPLLAGVPVREVEEAKGGAT
jgi:signal transduction histidine kinase